MSNNERSYMQNEIPESSNCFYMLLLKFIDISMSSVLIAPCVVAYWRGTWELIELLMLPMNSTVSAFISFAVGIVGHVFFTISQGTFKKSFDPDKKRLTYYIVSRSYTAVFGVVCVNMWRGTWNLCDNLTSKTSLGIILLTTLLSLLILILIRTTRNLTAAPFVISTDHKSTYFEISTIFKTEKFHRSTLYILDTFFSIIVVGTLVVVAWRGVWEMLDLTFYRNNDLISAFGSLIAGYGLVVIMFALQPIFQRTCKSVNDTLKLVLADCYYIISFIGAVNVWRGIWIFLDVNLYPDNQFKSYYVSHVIAYLTLTTLNCANSILVRGIAIDGEEGDSGCIEFSVAYVKQHFYNKKVQKYLKNEAQKQQNNLASKIN